MPGRVELRTRRELTRQNRRVRADASGTRRVCHEQEEPRRGSDAEGEEETK